MQILTAGVGNLPKPAMIFAYPSWNQTVEDEKRKQEVGKVSHAGPT
jgi:hypothetical protein